MQENLYSDLLESVAQMDEIVQSESCRNCVYFCGVYSPKVSMDYHTYVCVVEHFHSLRKDYGAQPHAITVTHSSRCEMHTTRTEFNNMGILK